jgi:shikimate kinase
VCDLDDRIAVAAGRTVREIFATDGEPAFRALERAAMAAALAEPPQVIAAGGGWAAQAGNLELVRDRAFTLYLSVSPAVAARRLAGTVDRPLLADTPLEARLAALLAEREPFYRLADRTMAVDHMDPERASAVVAELARQEAGW